MPTTLLAVDDSVTMRKVLEMTFAGEDIRVITADGAESAFAKLRAERPAVVLADVTLEGLNGYGLCARIKAELPTVPVILLASKQFPYDGQKGAAARADDYIEKPFDTQQLIDKVKRVLSRPATAAAPAAVPAGAAPAAAPAPAFAAADASGMRSSSTAPFGGARPAAPAMNASAPAVNVRPPAPTLAGTGGPSVDSRAALRGTLAYSSQPLPIRPAAPGGGSDGGAPSAPAGFPAAPTGVPSGSTGRGAPAPPPPPAAPAPASRAAAVVSASPAVAAVAAAPASPAAAAPAVVGAAAASAVVGGAVNGALASKLSDMGLTDAQVQGVLALSREVVERVVWEVVPTLAEVLIKEELKRLTSE